jgi:hypothetical protein
VYRNRTRGLATVCRANSAMMCPHRRVMGGKGVQAGDELGRGRREPLDEPLDLGYQPRQRRGRRLLRVPQVDGDPAVVTGVHYEGAEGARLAVVQRLNSSSCAWPRRARRPRGAASGRTRWGPAVRGRSL